MKIKVTKTRDGVQLSGSLPPELSSAQSAELFPLKGGLYLLSLGESIAGHLPPASQQGAFSEEEREVLGKLSAVKFEKRTPAEASRLLSSREKEVLSSLMQKGLVRLFKGGKYEKEGVLSITDSAYTLSKGGALPSAPQRAAPTPLDSAGYMVLESDSEARAFGSSNSERIKSGEIAGVRAFDRKYYFVTRDFMQKWEKKALSALSKEGLSDLEVAAKLSLGPEAARALLFHLCEGGEAMERHRGKFSRA